MDYYDQLPTPEEEAQAKLAALRGTQQAQRAQSVGLLGQLTGDKVLAPVGQSLQAGARHQMDLLEAMKQHQAQLGMARSQFAATQSDRNTDNERQAQQFDEAKRHNLVAEQAALTAARNGAGRQAGAADDRAERLKDKELAEFRKAVDYTQGKSNLPAQQMAAVQAAEHLEQLVAAGFANPGQVMEAATLAARIANGGNVPSEHQVAAMLPHTWKGELAKFGEYFLAKPQDAGAQEFLQNLDRQSRRQKSVSESQIRNMIAQRIPGYSNVLSRYPEAWNALPQGMSREHFDPQTLRLLKPYAIELGADAGGKGAPVKYLVSPDKKQRVPVFADGSKGPVEASP